MSQSQMEMRRSFEKKNRRELMEGMGGKAGWRSQRSSRAESRTAVCECVCGCDGVLDSVCVCQGEK